jgi:hypothetical protein
MWCASLPSFAYVDLVGDRPLLAKQPLEDSCLHRPALALLGGVASRLLAQPAFEQSWSSYPSALEIPGMPAGR